MYSSWPCPTSSGGTSDELLFSFDKDRAVRVLILPPLFDEANKFRRQIAGMMRLLDARGIDSLCPDLPGMNESVARHAEQSLGSWRIHAEAASSFSKATHVLTIRSSALIAPGQMHGWSFEPVAPGSVIQRLIRAEIVASKEAGTPLTAEELLDKGRATGVSLAGWQLGPELVCQLSGDDRRELPDYVVIRQDEIGGRPLWLRAENDFDSMQAEALVARIAGLVSAR